ncbi:MAG: patatin-like phospholipase family protein [Bacillota bacterium]|jgi:NTE family protein
MSRIGLALGGGSARGMAHIGILQALCELEIPVDFLAGTSSGSIIGALFAAGYSPDEMLEVARSTSWRDLSELLVPRRSLLGNERMEAKLQELTGGKSFEQLNIPFAAVCTELYSAEKVVLNEGSVALAVRASCSIPGIFEPVQWQDKLLVDGGLVENVPVRTVKEMGAEQVIAVDLYASAVTSLQVEGIMGVITRSFEIMQRQLSQSEFHQATVPIAPAMAGASLIDLAQAEQYIDKGYQAAMAHRQQLLQLL